MKTKPSRPLRTVVAAGLILLLGAASFGAATGHGDYVCPPCGHACLETSYEEAGRCPICGMELIPRADAINLPVPAPAAGDPTTVAILVFDGVEIIDFAGPWEVFGWAGFRVITVAETPDPIVTAFGMTLTPDWTFDEHPTPDIVLIPGGEVFGPQLDPDVQAWLRGVAERAEVVLSVCNGAYILATAGLLDGLRATTTRPLVEGLTAVSDQITAVENVRFVDNGKIVTAGGLSAGMDASLHVVSRYLGEVRAEEIARGLEYEWRRDGTEPPPPGGAEAPGSSIDRVLAALVADGLVGGVLLVADLEDGRQWIGSAGMRDLVTKAAVRPSDRFRLASITKAFTAAAVLRLRDLGELDLEDRIADHLTGEVFRNIENFEAVTLHQLLTHSAGLADFSTGREFWEEVFVGRGLGGGLEPLEALEYAAGKEPLSPPLPPDSGSFYSNTHYFLLGLLIEEVTGESFGDAIQRLVAVPMGRR